MPHFDLQYQPNFPFVTSPPHFGHFPVAAEPFPAPAIWSVLCAKIFATVSQRYLLTLCECCSLVRFFSAILCNCCSISAVFRGDTRASSYFATIATICFPLSVGATFCFLSVVIRFVSMSFSMMLALVADVPIPQVFICSLSSSSSMSLPAFSIARISEPVV